MTPLTELNLETAVPANLAEWLGSYFDGSGHAVGANPVVLFPRADLAFGQGAPRRPLADGDDGTADAGTGLEIRVVRLNVIRGGGGGQWPCDTILFSGRYVEDVVLFQFQIRAKRGGAGESELLAAQAADLVHAITNNPACRWVLAQHGITHLRSKPAEVVPSTDYALRLVYVTASLSYAVQFGLSVDNPVLTDAYDNRYRLGIADGQLTLSTTGAVAGTVVLTDAGGNNYELSIVGTPQIAPVTTAAPGAEYLSLKDATGTTYRVRIITVAGVPILTAEAE